MRILGGSLSHGSLVGGIRRTIVFGNLGPFKEKLFTERGEARENGDNVRIDILTSEML